MYSINWHRGWPVTNMKFEQQQRCVRTKKHLFSSESGYVSFNISSSSSSSWSWLSMMGGWWKVSTNNNWGTLSHSARVLEQIIKWKETLLLGKETGQKWSICIFLSRLIVSGNRCKDHDWDDWHLLKARRGTRCRWNRQHGSNSHPLAKPNGWCWAWYWLLAPTDY